MFPVTSSHASMGAGAMSEDESGEYEEEDEEDEEFDCVMYDDDLAYIDPLYTLRKPWVNEASWPELAEETIRFVRHALRYCDDGFVALHWLQTGYLALAPHSDELARHWRLDRDALRSFLHAHEQAARQEIAGYSSDCEGRGHSQAAYRFWADGDREWADAFTRGDFESMFYTRDELAERVEHARVDQRVGSDPDAHEMPKHALGHILSEVANRAAHLGHSSHSQ